jgi:type IV secretory pathway TraG/TraD family ATPase VirD4
MALGRATGRLSNRIAQQITTATTRRSATPSARSRRLGILVPGDPPPVGLRSTWMDYRGVVLPRAFSGFEGDLPFGSVTHPHGSSATPVALPWQVLNMHAAIVGPAGSGKTTNLFVPWAIEAIRRGISVVTVDVKGNLRDHLAAYAARTTSGPGAPFPLYHWDISDPAGSRPWNPFAELGRSASLPQVTTALLGAVDPHDRNKHFAERDHRWMTGILRLALALDPSPTPLLVYSLALSQQRLVTALQQIPSAATEVLDLAQYPVDEYARAVAGLANRLAWLSDPALQPVLSRSTFTLDNVVDGGGLFIVGRRLSGGEPAAAAASLALNLLQQRVLQGFGRNGPMLWLLDEAPTYVGRIEIDTLLATVREAGVGVALGLQDVAQLGDEVAQTRALSNCQTFLAMSGTSATTASFLSSRLGTHDAGSSTWSPNPHGVLSPSVSRSQVPVLGTREIMYPPTGQFSGIAHVPAITDRPWIADFNAR